jgi:hypothetical protein
MVTLIDNLIIFGYEVMIADGTSAIGVMQVHLTLMALLEGLVLKYYAESRRCCHLYIL